MEKQKIKILSLCLLASLGIIAGYSIGILYDHQSSKSIINPLEAVKENSLDRTEDLSDTSEKIRKSYNIENLMTYNVNDSIYNLMKKNISEKGDTLGGKVYNIDTNSKGFREDQFNKSTPNNTFRILVIGDSYTFGWGINKSNRYTEILERRLNRKHQKKYQVINAGIPGWGLEDYYNFLKERGLNYSPDIIVIGLVGNDYISHVEHSKLQREAKKQISRKYNISKETQEYHDKVLNLMRIKLEKYRANRSERESDTYRYTKKIQNISERENISTSFYQIGVPWVKSQKILDKINEINYVSTPEEIRKNRRKYRFESDSHYNVKAQTLLADRLYHHLKNNYSIPN